LRAGGGIVTLLLALGFYALGAISTALFMGLMMAWHYAHRPPPPTLYNRRYRDAPERVLSREGISDERDRVQYEWINLTGEEK
jgi:hypothetical protein